jgi:hypothetical protein
MSSFSVLAVEIGENTPLGNGFFLGKEYSNLAVLIQVILRNAFTVIGLLLLILLIYGGLMYIIGAGDGDSKKAAQAQSTITDALIGFAVVFLAYFIIQIIQLITGINILNSTL